MPPASAKPTLVNDLATAAATLLGSRRVHQGDDASAEPAARDARAVGASGQRRLHRDVQLRHGHDELAAYRFGMKRLIDDLLASDEPSVRWKVRRWVLDEPPDGRPMRRLQEDIRRSARVQALLARREEPLGVYAKWQGLHWVLSTLADLGYPAADPDLLPLRDRVLEHWLRPEYYNEFEAATKAATYRRRGVPVMAGRARRCASQQGNALLYLTTLGLTDDRLADLVERLLHWQWPDGGWNCDREQAAAMSSFNETLLPMRGLAAHGRATGDAAATAATRRAAEVFLERRLYKRRRDGRVIHHTFIRLHYPLYWHYDILGGLRGMVDVGLIGDSRCLDALDLLEAKALPDGGWAAEASYQHQRRRAAQEVALHSDYVDWGGASSKRRSDWVTADALAVLHAAGRL
jgi:hypothetical protein